MALNTSKGNHLMPLRFKRLRVVHLWL